MPACSPSPHFRLTRFAVTLLLLLGAAAGGARARAHDYWLEPGSPWAARGDEMVLHLWMGGLLKGEEERPLQKERLSRFDLFGDRSGRRDLSAQGREGQVPVAKARLEGGSALVVMDRSPRPITMEAGRFNAYLTDEGAEAALAARREQGQSDQAGREIYSRYLKSLIQERDQAAATPNTLYKRRVGQRLEILLENDPRRLRPDGSLTVKVLFEDRPLAGAKVFACRRAAEGQPPFVLTAATDAKGLAAFKLDQPGLWLVRLVHVRPAPPPEHRTENAPQWESSWAAYTFGARMVADPAPCSKPGRVAPAGNARGMKAGGRLPGLRVLLGETLALPSPSIPPSQICEICGQPPISARNPINRIAR